MFTGIVRGLGTIALRKGPLLRVRACPGLGALPRGASVSVNGACLTLARKRGRLLEFEVSAETYRLTNLGALAPGDAVALEPSLRAADLIGGHWVSGHVDARARVLQREPQPGGFTRLRVSLPAALRRFVAHKGSIAVDGTSLTVTRVGRGFFESVLIPETLARTTLGARRPGDAVNLEIDLVARYLDSLLARRKPR